MSAIQRSPSFATGTPVVRAWQQIRRFGPLGPIALLHVLFFYALQSGLLHQAAQALPKEVFASFITPDAPQPILPQPQPAAPKTVAVVKKAAIRPPVAPAIDLAPSPQAITAPPAVPAASDSPAVAAAAAAPAPAASAQPKTISGVEYIQAPQPDYPPSSKRLGEQGKVLLRVLVNENGRPERVDVQNSSGSARLDEAARLAVLRALFKPYIEDGMAHAVYALVPINFRLDNF